MITALLIVIIILALGGGGYWGNRAGWYGSNPGPAISGLAFLALLVILLLLYRSPVFHP